MLIRFSSNQAILATEMVRSKSLVFSLKNIRLVSCDKSSMESVYIGFSIHLNCIAVTSLLSFTLIAKLATAKSFLLALPTKKAKDIVVFRFIIEYSSLTDFGPY
jgi:hypothetical protein